MEFNFISPGRYKIGSPEDDPDRFFNEYRAEIHFDKGFYIQTTEVTVGNFREFVKATGYVTDAERSGGAFVKEGKKWRQIEAYHWNYPGFSQTENHPVTCVSFNDIKMFIEWLNEKEKKTYRLPTEEEWESACRAGTTTIRYWGNSVNSACFYANIYDITGRRVNKMHWDRHFCDDGIARTAPVARYKPNNFGLYDMLGNVWEWCSDFYRHTLDIENESRTDVGGEYRVIRGGSWESSPAHARSAMRQGQLMSSANPYMGFRLILEH
jgi:formylglycine-generating enzyme required for sulfatase activity